MLCDLCEYKKRLHTNSDDGIPSYFLDADLLDLSLNAGLQDALQQEQQVMKREKSTSG
jgi:hypothetical protein